ncbi:MAG: sugar phosphate isomerase/epimerase [Anaerolineales bacterium]|nr:sugar phosphate isomerase/epimerase [Anaerolineales bacterium]
MLTASIAVGMNGRFFPQNWRPARQEIAFAAANGFAAIQFPGEPQGLGAARLGAAAADVGAMLAETGVAAVMEHAIHVRADGLTPRGDTPLAEFERNLAAIVALGCTAVHWHLVPDEPLTPAAQRRLETAVLPQLETAVAISAAHGFRFGLEHNAPNVPLFNTPAAIGHALDAVPGLGFVWDFNHTLLETLPAFAALAPRMSMLHISDAPLPETNYHWPLGQGTIDVAGYCQMLRAAGFQGVGVLEIGGAPWSGGFDQDTDAALVASRAVIAAALAA